VIPLGMGKLEWCGYPTVKKFEDTFKRFDTIPVCDGQTDGQTSCHSIVRAMHTRRVVKIIPVKKGGPRDASCLSVVSCNSIQYVLIRPFFFLLLRGACPFHVPLLR